MKMEYEHRQNVRIEKLNLKKELQFEKEKCTTLNIIKNNIIGLREEIRNMTTETYLT